MSQVLGDEIPENQFLARWKQSSRRQLRMQKEMRRKFMRWILLMKRRMRRMTKRMMIKWERDCIYIYICTQLGISWDKIVGGSCNDMILYGMVFYAVFYCWFAKKDQEHVWPKCVPTLKPTVCTWKPGLGACIAIWFPFANQRSCLFQTVSGKVGSKIWGRKLTMLAHSWCDLRDSYFLQFRLWTHLLKQWDLWLSKLSID